MITAILLKCALKRRYVSIVRNGSLVRFLHRIISNAKQPVNFF